MNYSLIAIFIALLSDAHATIAGLTFMDPVNRKLPRPQLRDGEDPCNPLYWYPRNIPDYCNVPTPAPYTGPPTCPPKPPPPPAPTTPCPVPRPTACPMPAPLPPMPVPIPLPAPIPIPAFPVPMPLYPPFPYPLPPVPGPTPCPPRGGRQSPMGGLSGMPMGGPMNAPMGMPMGMPMGGPMGMPMGGPMGMPMGGLMGMPMMQAAPSIMNYYRPPFGLIASPMSKDGGINILPFSDVYSDAADRMKYKRIAKLYERRKHRSKKHKVIKFYDSDSSDESSS